MKASKIVVAQAAAGLVAGGLESRKIRVVLEMEGSMTGLVSFEHLVRIRDASGKWHKVSSVKHRLEAMGARVVHVEDAGRGEHLPVHP